MLLLVDEDARNQFFYPDLDENINNLIPLEINVWRNNYNFAMNE